MRGIASGAAAGGGRFPHQFTRIKGDLKMKNATVIAICVLVLAGAALADWDETQPAKWVQLPDRSPEGMDVKVGYSFLPGTVEPVKKVLADDFECTQTGPITDIHIWGSWKDDELPTFGPDGGIVTTDAGNISFRLGIWSDKPAHRDPLGHENHSQPFELLWSQTFEPGEFSVIDAFQGPEGWYDPNEGFWEPDNHYRAFQYNFFIDEADAFQQQGGSGPDEEIVYWLSVDVDVLDMETDIEYVAEFGWKTSEQHWNDDATFRDEIWVDDPGMPGGGFFLPEPWRELRYPDGHPFQMQSIDMAFVITPEPATMTLLAIGGLAVLRRRRRS